MTEEKKYTEAEAQRFFAGRFNNQVWSLLQKSDRTGEDDELMIHTAHASCCHWLQIGTGLNHQRGEWLIAHVYTVLGLSEPALRHAQRCQQLTKEYADLMHDFDRAYAYEGLARANALAGNRQDALHYLKLAQDAGAAIADDYAILDDGATGTGFW